MKRITYNFFIFLQHPTIEKARTEVKYVPGLPLFLFIQVFSLPFAFLDQIPLVKHFFEIQNDNLLTDFLKNKFIFFISVVLIAPVIEEFLFRFYLNSEMYIPALLSGCVAACIGFSISNIPILFWVLYGIITLLILQALYSNLKCRDLLRKIQHQHFKLIFYTSAILFGITHVVNYNTYGYKAFLAIILVLPQLIGGLYLGFLRLKYNFRYAVLGHVLNNLIAYFVFYILF